MRKMERIGRIEKKTGQDEEMERIGKMEKKTGTVKQTIENILNEFVQN